MGSRSIDCRVAEGQWEGGAVIPGGPLIHEKGTQRVGGFAEDEVQGAVVEIGEVGGEALGGAEAAAYLLDRDVIATLRLQPGAGGHAEDALKNGRLAVDGVLDVAGSELAVVPLGQVDWSMVVGEGL